MLKDEKAVDKVEETEDGIPCDMACEVVVVFFVCIITRLRHPTIRVQVRQER